MSASPADLDKPTKEARPATFSVALAPMCPATRDPPLYVKEAALADN